MKKIAVWLNQDQFKRLKQKADRLGISHYAYVKALVLESLT